MRPEAITALIATLGFISYSLGDAGIKFAAEGISSIQVAAIVMSFSLVPSLVHLWQEGKIFSPLPNRPRLVALAALFQLCQAPCVFYSFATMPMSLVYAAVFAMPIITNGLSALVLGEAIGPRRIAAILIGFVGVLIALDPGQVDLGWRHLALIGIPLFGAAGGVVVRMTAPFEAISVMNFWPGFTVALGMMAVALPGFEPVPGATVLLLAGTALFGWFGHVLYMVAMRRGPVVTASAMQYSQVIWGGLIGFFLFGENPTAMVFLGSTLIIAAGLYIMLRAELPRVAAGVTPAPAKPPVEVDPA